MSLDSVFKARFENDPWFKAHPAAWAIINGEAQEISSKKPDNFNLQCLLSNMCNYGAKKWKYEPGSKVNIEQTLKGTFDVTDCASLANIFCEIASHLGFAGAIPRKIEKPGHRIVTKPGIITFNNRKGDPTLEGRWCFGDHWVAEYKGVCYDPTFKFQGFAFGAAGQVYLGWYAKEERDPSYFTKTYWKADPTVPGSRNVYMRMVPSVAYTFRTTDPASGREN